MQDNGVTGSDGNGDSGDKRTKRQTETETELDDLTVAHLLDDHLDGQVRPGLTSTIHRCIFLEKTDWN